MLPDPAWGKGALSGGGSSGVSRLTECQGLCPGTCWQKEGAGQASTCSRERAGATGDLGGWIKSVWQGMGLLSFLELVLNLFTAKSGSVSWGDPGLRGGRGRWKEGLVAQNPVCAKGCSGLHGGMSGPNCRH